MKGIIRLLIASALSCHVGCGAERGGATAGEEGATIGVTASALAETMALSPQRDPNKSWREYADASRRLSTLAAATATVLDSKVAPANADFSQVPVWPDVDIKMQFRAVRDLRVMHGVGQPTFARRASWLFPDNGCFARAELAASAAGDNGKVKPYKLFSFGNLVVQTNNSASGVVTWWYHVVPVVKSATSGQVYVLDPAIDPSQPLDWQSWLLKQVPVLDGNVVQVTVADSNAYSPSSPVVGAANERTAALSQMEVSFSGGLGFLDQEWNRQVQLQRDPTIVLGDGPPWGREKQYFVSSDPSLILSACKTCLGADALSVRCVNDCP